MIIVIVLNLVFWWLPFFKICFPVPLKGKYVKAGRSLGRGISFPPRVGPDGRLAWSAGEQNIREAIRVILMTELRRAAAQARVRRRADGASCSSPTR